MQKAKIKGKINLENIGTCVVPEIILEADSIEIVEDKPKRDVKIGDVGINPNDNNRITFADNSFPEHKIGWLTPKEYVEVVPKTLFNILEIVEEGKKVKDGKTETIDGVMALELENDIGKIDILCYGSCIVLSKPDFRRFCAQGLVLAREK